MLGNSSATVVRKASARGRPLRITDVTARGKAAFKKLNALSQEQAHTILQDLAPTARTKLVQCMQTIENTSHEGLDLKRPPFILCGCTIAAAIWDGVVRPLCKVSAMREQFGWDSTSKSARLDRGRQFVTNFDAAW